MADPDDEDFTDGYITAALWSSTDDDDEPLDANYTEDDIDPATLEEMANDARDFYDDNYDLLFADGNDAGKGGHNLWLTRNGHGAGFWDGDYPIHGDELTKRAKAYGEEYLYVGDDGKIYI